MCVRRYIGGYMCVRRYIGGCMCVRRYIGGYIGIIACDDGLKRKVNQEMMHRDSTVHDRDERCTIGIGNALYIHSSRTY